VQAGFDFEIGCIAGRCFLRQQALTCHQGYCQRARDEKSVHNHLQNMTAMFNFPTLEAYNSKVK
jgi:hypothetical protein